MSFNGLDIGVTGDFPSCNCLKLEAPVFDSPVPPRAPSPDREPEPGELEVDAPDFEAESGRGVVPGAHAAKVNARMPRRL
jgi:hypothetical protein